MRQLRTGRATRALLCAALAASATAALAVDLRFQRLADGTVPTLPTRWLTGNDERLELGDLVFEFKHRVGARTRGDTTFWLPQKNAAPYLRLLNSAELIPGNASRAYLEMERE